MLDTLDRVLLRNAELFLSSVPFASHLNDDAPLDERYYIRHRIETIKRIRMTAKTDALALAAMVDEDYDAARLWSDYAAEELGHDRMFLEDLAKHGVTAGVVDGTEPFPATWRMIAYLTDRISEFGSLPAVAYSVLVEWNSERFSGRAIDKARRRFGDEYVAGSGSHYEIDETEDHYATMVEVARRVMAARGYAPDVLYTLIDGIAGHLRDYFTELYEATVALPVA